MKRKFDSSFVVLRVLLIITTMIMMWLFENEVEVDENRHQKPFETYICICISIYRTISLTNFAANLHQPLLSSSSPPPPLYLTRRRRITLEVRIEEEKKMRDREKIIISNKTTSSTKKLIDLSLSPRIRHVLLGQSDNNQIDSLYIYKHTVYMSTITKLIFIGFTVIITIIIYNNNR